MLSIANKSDYAEVLLMANGDRRKIKLNFIFGLSGQIITLIIGLFIPRLFIMSFGSEVNGFLNSVNQVFVYIALLEAGVGAASTQALYGPTGKGDHDKINGILSATHHFYIKTAICYTVSMIVLAFLFPLFVRSTLNYWMMFAIVLLVGSSSVVAYYAHAKYKLFLSVEGKDYVNTAITTTQQVLLSICKAILLVCGFNVLVVQSSYLLLNVLQALAYKGYVKKKYSWINLKVKPDKEAISQKNSVLIHQISTLIFNNTDVLVLTFFCDLNAVSIYALYKNFINIIGMLVNNFANSLNFKLGQSYHNNREYFFRMHNVYETFHVTLTFSLCTIAYLFFMPFIKLYTAGMDIDYCLTYMPLLIVLVEILSYARLPMLNVISYAGHFRKTQWRSLAESVINLGSSLIFVSFLGIYGVLMGTVIALLYRINDIIFYANHKLLNRSVWPTYRLWLVNIVFAIVTVEIFNLIPFDVSSYFSLFVVAAIVCILVVPLQIVINFLINKSAGIEMLKIIRLKREKNKEN